MKDGFTNMYACVCVLVLLTSQQESKGKGRTIQHLFTLNYKVENCGKV